MKKKILNDNRVVAFEDHLFSHCWSSCPSSFPIVLLGWGHKSICVAHAGFSFFLIDKKGAAYQTLLFLSVQEYRLWHYRYPQETEFQGPRDTFSALVVLTLRAVMMHDADVLGILLPQHAIGYTLCGI